jgi:hypothetical protein
MNNNKPSYLLFCCALFTLSISCGKKNTASLILQRVDTVKYEAILNGYTSDWCVTSVVPDFKSISGNPLSIGPYGNAAYTNFECGETQNEEITFTVNKYINISIPLEMKAYNQWYGTPPYPDSIVTLNIYLNDSIVATQSSRIKDSIQYTIY